MHTATVSSPHAHDQSSVNRIMLHVCIALTPCTLFGLYLFGWPALNLFVITVGSALLWESLCLKLTNTSQRRLYDYSALVTGWLVAVTMPPWAPWWIGVAGSFVAIVIGKQLYGGIGQNVFNPAMLARVALLISFPVQMTIWPVPHGDNHSSLWHTVGFLQGLDITFGGAALPDGLSGATYLGDLKTEMSLGASAEAYVGSQFSFTDAFLGNIPGSLGETSALLILLGAGWLLYNRVISWHIPVSMLGTVLVLSLLFSTAQSEHYPGPLFHLLSGGMLLGAFFIATDPVTSPASKGGQLIFGTGCGLIDFMIRTWGSFPEAIGFAVLFMNALTPIIDLYLKPRIYGRNINGSPLTKGTSP